MHWHSTSQPGTDTERKMPSYCFTIRMWLALDFNRPESGSCPHSLTWEFLHAVDRAEVVLECTVAVHSHAEVEFRHEREKRACPVAVLDGADAHSQQPVDILHLLLPRKNTIPIQLTAALWRNNNQHHTWTAETSSYWRCCSDILLL